MEDVWGGGFVEFAGFAAAQGGDDELGRVCEVEVFVVGGEGEGFGVHCGCAGDDAGCAAFDVEAEGLDAVGGFGGVNDEAVAGRDGAVVVVREEACVGGIGQCEDFRFGGRV